MTGLPIIILPTAAVLGLNIALWASAQILAGYAAHRLPLDRLDHDGRLLRLRPFEDGGRWYRRRLHIDRWKDRLPEAGAFFAGGVTKRTLPDRHAGASSASPPRRAEPSWPIGRASPGCRSA